MSRWQKLLIGLAATFLAAWVSHGPLGQGAAYVDTLEAGARIMVGRTNLPGIDVRMGREPLSRLAFLAGPANDFQRDGMGSFPGLNRRVLAVRGISGVSWETQARVVPLLAEVMGLAALAWLIGLGLGWLIFRPRPIRHGYL